MYLFFPETNGLHLEEVDQIFRDSKNVFAPVKVAARFQKRVAGTEGGGKSSIDTFEDKKGPDA